MNVRELIGLIYGVFMGTSTVYLKPAREFVFPQSRRKFGGLEVVIGGRRNQIFGRGFSLDAENPSDSSMALSTRRNLARASGGAEPLSVKAAAALEGVVVRDVGPRNAVVWIAGEKALALGDFFYNGVHPPLKELEMPSVPVWLEILEGLVQEFQPELFIPAEGEPSQSLSEFTAYLKDLSDKTQDFGSLQSRYGHFREIVGHSSFSENFDFLRR
jgi:hypothetical protein